MSMQIGPTMFVAVTTWRCPLMRLIGRGATREAAIEELTTRIGEHVASHHVQFSTVTV
jgi:hypothetical protein